MAVAPIWASLSGEYRSGDGAGLRIATRPDRVPSGRSSRPRQPTRKVRCWTTAMLLGLAALVLEGLRSPERRSRARRPCRPPRQRPPMTASGRCRPRTTPAPASATLDQINTDNVKNLQARVHVLDRRRHAATRRRRSSSATRCTSSRRTRTCSTRSTSRKPGAPLKWTYEPKPGRASQGVACCDVVNRGAAYCERPHLLQHARRPDDRASTRRPASELWRTQARRHQPRRDDHDGAAGREGQGARRQQRRRVRRARLAHRARCGDRQASPGARTAPGPTRTC